MLDTVGRPETVQVVVSPGQVACLLAYAALLALWSYAELLGFTRSEHTYKCQLHMRFCQVDVLAAVQLRRGKGSGSPDEEHASPKVPEHTMQPLGAAQQVSQPPSSPAKDFQADAGVKRSGFIR